MHNILVEFAIAHCNGWVFVKDLESLNGAVTLKAKTVNQDGPTVEASGLFYQDQLVSEKAAWSATGVDEEGEHVEYSGNFQSGWTGGWENFLSCWRNGNIRDIAVSFPV